jgi:hypothetical protein
MRQWLVASLRAAWFVVSALTAASGCSFDRGAIPPPHQQPHRDAGNGDSGAGDARAVDPDDASMQPQKDAQAEASVPQPDAQTDATSEPDDAATEDAAMDAALDAAADAEADAGDSATDEDAGDEPDGSDPCGDPKPCVCPHEDIDENDECPPPVCAVDECAPDDDCRFLTFGSSRYYFCDDERTWEQARGRCESIAGAHLVTVQDDDEDEFVLDQISDKTWLGGSDGEDEGQWLWPDGTAFFDEEDDGPVAGRFNNWDSSEPNDTGLSASAADCLMYWYEQEAWADASCGDEHGYVCEID